MLLRDAAANVLFKGRSCECTAQGTQLQMCCSTDAAVNVLLRDAAVLKQACGQIKREPPGDTEEHKAYESFVESYL